MITFLRGKLVEKQTTRIVLDVGGVGYEVLVPLGSLEALPSVGGECTVLTYDCVREDSHQLFGFMSEGEREIFVLLMGISGIGPKLALSALSGLSVGELRSAIGQGDVARLNSISGIGKKTAERIVVDLRDKIGGSIDGASVAGGEPSVAHDAIMALVSLGYNQETARKMAVKAVSNLGEEASTEEVVRRALSG
ncbi:Holliday junction branch migration protein RuvA [bacterium B17]|nr:Holliday junction branch migration protein RuvA [bacterium B17]